MSKDTRTKGRVTVRWWERQQLERQGCRASDWSAIEIKQDTDLSGIRDTIFEGSVSIGAECLIEKVRIVNSILGDRVRITDTGLLRNSIVGNDVVMERCDAVEFEPETMCGIGTEVCVLDETGTRSVTIFPELTAQSALLQCREPKWRENHYLPMLAERLDNLHVEPAIEDGARLSGCGLIRNVAIGRDVVVEGALALRNGTIINNAAPGKALAYIGPGVDAENFIIVDGRMDSGVIARNCFVGQGATLEKGFTAHDSLFFANCQMENGEACALFGGPYSVSMHKASLLIGCQTSFLNAGSGTNQSNHMYKLGPVHWGILERGVKTSSASYLMLGAKIGAFSLLMGQHKTHPDSSEFPFSYLFGDDRGATVVVPGVMLRSCGLMRDEQKWPARDRRLKRRLPIRDRIVFDVLSPLTVDKMLSASEVIDSLLMRPADDDRYLRYRGMKFTRAALERARHLYELAIYKYLDRKCGEEGVPGFESGVAAEEWVDIAGLPMTRGMLRKAMEAESPEEVERMFDTAFFDYAKLEKEWIARRFAPRWHQPREVIRAYAADFDRMIEEDRQRYLEELSAQASMLAL